jgi:DNA polymerase-1
LSKKNHKKKNDEQFDLYSAIASDSQPMVTSSFIALENTAHSYQIIQGDLGTNCCNLLKQESVCFDTETTGLDALHAELVGISFSYEKEKFLFFPENQKKHKKLIDAIPFFEKKNIEKIGQNLKYDLKNFLTTTLL